MTVRTDSDSHASAVEDLLALLETLYPDPVDVFEDGLATRLGFVRRPSCSLDEWRRLRVRLIDAAEDEGGLPGAR